MNQMALFAPSPISLYPKLVFLTPPSWTCNLRHENSSNCKWCPSLALVAIAQNCAAYTTLLLLHLNIISLPIELITKTRPSSNVFTWNGAATYRMLCNGNTRGITIALRYVAHLFIWLWKVVSCHFLRDSYVVERRQEWHCQLVSSVPSN